MSVLLATSAWSERCLIDASLAASRVQLTSRAILWYALLPYTATLNLIFLSLLSFLSLFWLSVVLLFFVYSELNPVWRFRMDKKYSKMPIPSSCDIEIRIFLGTWCVLHAMMNTSIHITRQKLSYTVILHKCALSYLQCFKYHPVHHALIVLWFVEVLLVLIWKCLFFRLRKKAGKCESRKGFEDQSSKSDKSTWATLVIGLN